MNPIFKSVKKLPHNIKLAFSNPHRRRNIGERITESLVGLGVFYATTNLLVGVIAAIVSEFLFFEIIAEPSGFSGYYWERGPREGESPGDDGYWEE